MINNSEEWRVSKSGFSIKTGWGDEKNLVAQYPYSTNPVDTEKYQQWLENAELICELYNSKFSAGKQDKGEGE